MANQRTERLGSEIQRALAQILREDVRDPRVSSMMSVLRAEVTPDLDICKVYISVYGSSEEQEQSVKALKKAAPFIRRRLGQRIEIRKLPELKFIYDDSIEYSVRLSALIDSLNVQDTDGEKE
mgnify:CR=1 FL=1